MMRDPDLLTFTLLALLTACRHDRAEDLGPAGPSVTPYELGRPYYFPELQIPADDPLTVEGIALGRRLYYDPILSTGGPLAGLSCSSCHSQSLSFSVPNNGPSVLPHVNLAWSRNFLWNGKVQGDLEDIMRFEVEEFFQVDLNVLRNHPVYPELFRDAFAEDEITGTLVEKALAQWFRRLVSSNSRFDSYLRHEIEFTTSEFNGMMVFMTETGDCFHCHGIPLMTDNAFHNIGLDSAFTPADQGRYLVTGDPADLGAFKAPTLRNVALTAPYMHDGRFQTLEEVVEHYDSGVNPSPSLDPIMTKPGQQIHLGLNPMQKADLLAFLHTLTDDSFITDTALASPF